MKYPKLILPELYNKYDSYEEHLFFDLPEEEKMPSKPIFEPQARRIMLREIAQASIFLLIILTIAILFIYFGNFWVIIFTIVGLISILRWALKEGIINPEEWSIKREEEKFSQEMSAYTEKCNKIQEKNQKLQMRKKEILGNLENYTSEKKKEVLRNYNTPSTIHYLDNKNKSGASEKMFATYLLQYFYNLVSIDECLVCENRMVYPDFIIRCEQFILAMEVDEPYSLADMQPIHFSKQFINPVSLRVFDSTSDADNEYHYKENNWCIIRFTENQIANNPVACCKYIADVMVKLAGVNDISELTKKETTNFKDIEPLTEENTWTEEEAYTFIEQNYRENALQKVNKVMANVLIFIPISIRGIELKEDEILLYNKYSHFNFPTGIIIANREYLAKNLVIRQPFYFNCENFSTIKIERKNYNKFEDLPIYRLEKKIIL